MARNRMHQTMRREARMRRGSVPSHLGGDLVAPGSSVLSANEYLLRTESGIAFHYRQGDGVVIEHASNVPSAEIDAWANGAVLCAIAAINGFLPLHASAIAIGGKAIAFAGPSGGGKSTIAAAFNVRGATFIADDVLVVDPRGPEQPICLPGPRYWKLTPAAIDLSGTALHGQQEPTRGKYHVPPNGAAATTPVELAAICLIGSGGPSGLHAISAGEAATTLLEDGGRSPFYRCACKGDIATTLKIFGDLAQAVECFRLVRSADPSQFHSTLESLEPLVGQSTPP